MKSALTATAAKALNPAVLFGRTEMFHALRNAPLVAFAAVAITSTNVSAAPSVTLSPVVNHPSSQVTVTGSGFGASKGIDIYWDTTDEMLVISDSTGAFSNKPIPVPTSALPGTHWVTALERDNGNGAQAGFTVRTDWVEHGFGSRGHRYNPYENIISPANAANLDVAWTYTTGDIVESSPAVVGGVVYIGSNDGHLYALDALTGAKKWGATIGKVDYSSPAVVGGVAYVGTMAGKIFALNATNGSVKWVYPSSGNLGFNVQSSPTVVGNVVYIGADDGNLYALNASTGAKLWNFTTTAGVQMWSAPAIDNGVLYTGSGNNNIYAINTTTHAEVWHVSTGNVVLSSPAVAKRIVFIGSYDHYLYDIPIDNPMVFRSADTGGPLLSSPAFGNGFVYIGVPVSATEGAVDAFDATELIYSATWTFQANRSVYSSPALANGVIYFGQAADNVGGEVNALDASTGKLLWEIRPDSIVTSSPAVANGMVYVGCYDHRVYAFALDAGANIAYHRDAHPPSYASLHANLRLRPMD